MCYQHDFSFLLKDFFLFYCRHPYIIDPCATLSDPVTALSVVTSIQCFRNVLCCEMLLQGLNFKHTQNHRRRLWWLRAYTQAFVGFSSGHLSMCRHWNVITTCSKGLGSLGFYPIMHHCRPHNMLESRLLLTCAVVCILLIHIVFRPAGGL